MLPKLDAAIDLDLVARFVRVAEARSFAAASARTGLPKSTLSRSVSRLEQAIGVRLLERTSRALRLTDEGARLYETASLGLATIGEALDLAAESPTRLRGTLRISAPPDLAQFVLAALVAEFVAAHPEIRVEVALSSRYVDLVKEGFDATFRAGTLRDSGLVARKLHDLPAAIYAAPSYLAAHPAPKRPSELEHHEFVVFRATEGEQRITLRGPKGTAKVTASGRVGSDDLAFVREACVAGCGMAWLPTLVGERDAKAGRLVRVLPAFDSTTGGLHLVYPSSRLAPARLVAFREFSAKYFRECEKRA